MLRAPRLEKVSHMIRAPYLGMKGMLRAPRLGKVSYMVRAPRHERYLICCGLLGWKRYLK